MSKNEDELVEFFDCKVIHVTDKAVLVKMPEMEQPQWFPQSQIHANSEIWKQDDEGTLVVTRWIAETKGLV